MTGAGSLRSGKSHRDENFPVASWLIDSRHRGPILAFYQFVRTADDIADHMSTYGRAPQAERGCAVTNNRCRGCAGNREFPEVDAFA